MAESNSTEIAVDGTSIPQGRLSASLLAAVVEAAYILDAAGRR